MRPPLATEINTSAAPVPLAEALRGEPGIVLLHSVRPDGTRARYSFVGACPFLVFRSFGSRCELRAGPKHWVQFGNPWRVLDSLMARYELLDEVDLPFPLGGCFGFWGYDLKNFVEPKLGRRAHKDLDLPDCHVGFYDSLGRSSTSWSLSRADLIQGRLDIWGSIAKASSTSSSGRPFIVTDGRTFRSERE